MYNANAVEITEDIFNKVCNDMSNSPQGLTHILKPYGINRVSFLEYKEKNKERIDKYARAKDAQIEYLADEINRLSYEMADMVRKGGIYDEITINPAVKTMQIQVDALKWQLSKLAPKKYGDKVAVEHEGEINHVVTGMKIV